MLGNWSLPTVCGIPWFGISGFNEIHAHSITCAQQTLISSEDNAVRISHCDGKTFLVQYYFLK